MIDITDWQIAILGGMGGFAVWSLYSIEGKLAAILFVLRHQAGLDQETDISN